MISPPYLNIGDTVAIVAPARFVTKQEVQPAINLLNSWGLKVREMPNLYSVANQFSGSDYQRCNDFQEAIDDKEVKAIFAARGGYGSIRIIDKINFNPLINNPKWIIGFSDITVFISHLQRNYGIETIHAIMPINITTENANNENIKKLKSILFGEKLTYTLPSSSKSRKGFAKGELVGGNLSILYSLRGTEYDIDTNGKILFLEDIDEHLYHFDRMIHNLKIGGKLSELNGLIIGAFTKINDNDIPFGKDIVDIILEAVAEYKYPVLFNFPAGHIENNFPLIMGREVELVVGNNSINENYADDFASLTFANNTTFKRGFDKYKSMVKPTIYIILLFTIIYLLLSIII